MTFESTNIELESKFYDNWTHTQIQWPNVALDISRLTEWVRITHLPDESKIAQIGVITDVNRYFGSVVIGIFVRPTIGQLRAKVLSDHVADLWRTTQFADITMKTPEIVEVGISGGWYQVDVISSYHRSLYEAVSTLTATRFATGATSTLLPVAAGSAS